MSEATDRPTDDDAWAKACAEDLAAEKERLRGQGQAGPGATGTAAEELFKLFEAVADKVSGLNNPLFGAAAQGAVRQIVDQAKTAAKPVIERNPEVFDHLAAAGSELLAAYRSAVEGHEGRWTRGETRAPRQASDDRDPRGDGPDDGPAERIDLD
ncbi:MULTISPECIES: DUF5304 domain-containing protein [Streptomyces]|jgi:type VI protein secretion system component VasK|uniref:DUF5304 domain-containing protein n=1 Tax=Streptomyces TaxID=1883 RepID=UPI0004BD664A|nr:MULTISPECIES: DUF5304 domain-containing protein [Streptomyces]KJY17162.1 hypothetical protein VR43_31005 [Streptomyces sp. NRRL S-104]KOU33325.1 hypothetical protein ADK53_19005 [Streptomyces sp. WM6373]KOU59083.1 hypothetical protein ADK96_33385 [Streptomyces sp. IGB124]KOU70658.1 hypothetical protein ADK61_33355 [Streptomyces sp. XY66]KOU83886.1 hypothetical protein ADK93_26285 [Streptomyces sp. XY58]